MIYRFLLPLLVLFLIFGESQTITAQNAAAPSTTEATIVATKEVHFDFGKHELRPNDVAQLEQLLSQLEEHEYILLKITAHTDAIGSNGDNQLLSQRRGESVRSFLISKGIPDSLMQVSVYGEESPVATNDTDNGRQRNRRATIEVFRQQMLKKVEPMVAEPEPEAINPVEIKPKMSLIKGTVVDKTNGKPIEATVIIRSKTFRDSIQTDATGYFEKEVPENTIVGIDVYAPGYFFESQMMKVRGMDLPSLQIQLPPADMGAVAELKDLFFVGNKAVLLKKSEPVLPKVLLFMKINPDIKVEIGGHVNYPHNHPTNYKGGAGEFEQTLSNNRAKLVYEYLLQHGISEDRLSWKGYSNTQMKFPYARVEKEMAQNRRVEVKIVE